MKQSDAFVSGAMLAMVMPHFERGFDRVFAAPAFPFLFVILVVANLRTRHTNVYRVKLVAARAFLSIISSSSRALRLSTFK